MCAALGCARHECDRSHARVTDVTSGHRMSTPSQPSPSGVDGARACSLQRDVPAHEHRFARDRHLHHRLRGIDEPPTRQRSDAGRAGHVAPAVAIGFALGCSRRRWPSHRAARHPGTRSAGARRWPAEKALAAWPDGNDRSSVPSGRSTWVVRFSTSVAAIVTTNDSPNSLAPVHSWRHSSTPNVAAGIATLSASPAWRSHRCLRGRSRTTPSVRCTRGWLRRLCAWRPSGLRLSRRC